MERKNRLRQNLTFFYVSTIRQFDEMGGRRTRICESLPIRSSEQRLIRGGRRENRRPSTLSDVPLAGHQARIRTRRVGNLPILLPRKESKVCSMNRRIRDPNVRWCERAAMGQFGSSFPTQLAIVFLFFILLPFLDDG